MGFGHEKLDVYRAVSEGMLFARNRANTKRQKATPIPIPTPTPIGTGRSKRIANHWLQATAEAAPEPHVELIK
jgi:hypothetical protein